MKTTEIPQRLSSLRNFMQKNNLDAFIIPSTDAHLSEYPPKMWESRKWISGFTGSAGTAVVTKDKAGVWTDSRYFLQAADELENTGFDLFKMGLADTPDMTDWVIAQVGKGGAVGIDGLVYAASDAKVLKSKLENKGIKLETALDPFAEIWPNRPEIPKNKAFLLPDEITGESTRKKIKRINTALEKLEANGLIAVTLDAVAWIFNIRGNDVEFNPVTVAYGFISPKESVLFIDPDKLTDDTKHRLLKQGVKIDDYNQIFNYVSRLPENSSVCITGNKINYKLYRRIPVSCRIVDVPSPVDLMKSIKKQNRTQRVS